MRRNLDWLILWVGKLPHSGPVPAASETLSKGQTPTVTSFPRLCQPGINGKLMPFQFQRIN